MSVEFSWSEKHICNGATHYVLYTNKIMTCRVYTVPGTSYFGVRSHLPSLSVRGKFKLLSEAMDAAEKGAQAWVRKISGIVPIKIRPRSSRAS